MNRAPLVPAFVLLAAISVLGAGACKVTKHERGAFAKKKKKTDKKAKEAPPPATPDDFGEGFSPVKAALLADAKNCFLPELTVCLDDDAIFAEVFAKVMSQPMVTKRVGEDLPTEGKDLDLVVRSASMTYRLAQKATPERRAAIEKRIEARYASPVIEIKGGLVVADHGYLPGPIEAYRNTWRLGSSPLGGGGAWKTSEVSRLLGALDSAHPQATRLQITARAASLGSTPRATVSYTRTLDRIRFERAAMPDSYYLSKKLDGNFDDLQARGISLDLREMYSCSRKSAAQGGGACTPTLGD